MHGMPWLSQKRDGDDGEEITDIIVIEGGLADPHVRVQPWSGPEDPPDDPVPEQFDCSHPPGNIFGDVVVTLS